MPAEVVRSALVRQIVETGCLWLLVNPEGADEMVVRSGDSTDDFRQQDLPDLVFYENQVEGLVRCTEIAKGTEVTELGMAYLDLDRPRAGRAVEAERSEAVDANLDEAIVVQGWLITNEA